MPKQIIFNEAVRNSIKAGVSKLAAAVKTTLGPSGKVVLYAREYGDPIFTKDGVTVAKEVELSDPLENMGAQIVRQATSKTASLAGDGTTTATIYVESIYEAGLKHIANGAKAREIKMGIELAVKTISDGLRAAALPVVSIEQLKQVGICSANQDVEIGTIVAEAIEKVGKDGVVTIQEGGSLETTTELVDGLQFNRGWLHQNFVTNQETLRAEYEKPAILVTDQKLSSIKTIMPWLEGHMKNSQGVGLVIIAEEIDGDGLGLLVVNHTRGAFKAVAVKAPDFGDRRRAQLEDIAVMTGATLITAECGIKWDQISGKHFGSCEKIIIDRDSTTIINGTGDKAKIDARIEQAKAQLNALANDFDKERAQERLAKLTGGVARITVGGATEAEIREKKDRIDDALHACKAATTEGILPGGGISALYVSRSLDKLKGLTDDQKLGVSIIKKAVEGPLRQIVKNTGEDDGPVLAEIKKKNNDPNFGYNAVTGKFGDMYEFGVIVPALVELVALQNAASVAILLLTTDCMIAPIPTAPESPQVQSMGPMS
jgi:chaperonin GroEL